MTLEISQAIKIDDWQLEGWPAPKMASLSFSKVLVWVIVMLGLGGIVKVLVDGWVIIMV